MSRDTWVWSWGIGTEPHVELAKMHLWEEIVSGLAGRALRYSRLWGISCKVIGWIDDRREVVLRIPITMEQLRLLDTEGLYDDDDDD